MSSSPARDSRIRRLRVPSVSELVVGLVCVLAAVTLTASLLDRSYLRGVVASLAGLVAAGQYLNQRVLDPRRQRRRREAALGNYLRSLREDALALGFPISQSPAGSTDLYVASPDLEPLSGSALRSAERRPLSDLREALSEHRHVLVEGEPGVGKSVILNRLIVQLIDALNSPDARVVPIGLGAPIVAQRRKPLPLALSEAVNDTMGIRLERELSRDFFEEPPASGQSWLILLDGLDELVTAASRTEFMRGVTNNLDRFRFVIATRPLAEAGRGDWQEFGCYRLPGFSVSHAKEFVGARFGTPSFSASEGASTEAFLRSLKSGPAGKLIASNPLLLGMAVAEWERTPGRPLSRSRAALYERFITRLLEDHEGKRASRMEFRAEWTPLGKAAEQLADRLFDGRRGLLQIVAAQQDQGRLDDGGKWLRAILGKEDQAHLRRFDETWLREQVAILLESTGLVGTPQGRVQFFHETFREYLFASGFASQTRATEWAAWGFVADNWREWRREVVLFAAGIWAEAGEEMTELIARIRHGMGQYAAAAVLAEGVEVDEALRALLLEDFLHDLWRSSTNVSLWDLGDHLDIAERLAHFPPNQDFLIGALLGIANDASALVAARAAVYEAAARMGCRDDALEGIRALREETWRQAEKDPMAGQDCLSAVSALSALGERQEAIEFLRELGARRLEEPNRTGATQRSILERVTRARAADALDRLGERDEAIAILQDVCRDPSSDSVSRAIAATSLENMGSRVAALYALTRVAQDPREVPHNRLNVCDKLVLMGERHVAVSVASQIALNPRTPPAARTTAAGILERLGKRREAMTVLTEVLDPTPLETVSGERRIEAAKMLLQVGGPVEKAAALDALAEVADDAETAGYRRIEAIELLGTHHRRALAISLLTGFTEETVWAWDRLRAALLLIQLGEQAGVRDVLRGIMRDQEESSRTSLLDRAAKALEAVARPTEVVDVLREVMHDPTADGRLRVDAAEVLGWRDRRREAIGFLMEVASDVLFEAAVRGRAAGAACRLGEYARSLPVLWEIVHARATGPRARYAVASSLLDLDHQFIAAPRLFQLCLSLDISDEARVEVGKALELAGHARLLPAQDAILILETVVVDLDLGVAELASIESTLRVLREQSGIAIVPRWLVDLVSGS